MEAGGIIAEIRNLILEGKLAQGSRVTEIGLSEMLGVSRTPVRNVLPALAAEGLLERYGKRGYAVRSFSARESIAALELRSSIEGSAAKMVAMEGMSDELRETLHMCLAKGDNLFTVRSFTKKEATAYGEMNGLFHQSIVESARSEFLLSTYARVNLVPFVSPFVIAFDLTQFGDAFDILFHAHMQHHDIVGALEDGDGSRADWLFREHSHQQRRSMWADVRRASAPNRKRGKKA